MVTKVVFAKHKIQRPPGTDDGEAGFPMSVTKQEYEEYMEAGAIADCEEAHKLILGLPKDVAEARLKAFKAGDAPPKKKADDKADNSSASSSGDK